MIVRPTPSQNRVPLKSTQLVPPEVVGGYVRGGARNNGGLRTTGRTRVSVMRKVNTHGVSERTVRAPSNLTRRGTISGR